MNIPNKALEWTEEAISYIISELIQADTTITPEVMEDINKISRTQETHQDDREIMQLVQQRLSECNDDEIFKIREFLEALSKSTVSASDKISIIWELKMELATNSEKSINDILIRCHNNLIQSISNTRGEFDSTMNSWPNTLH